MAEDDRSKSATAVGLVFGIYANTQVGESIRVIGETEELGKWNLADSVQLCTDGKSYPMWTTAEPVWIQPKPGKKRLEPWMLAGELKIRPGSRNGSFESRRNLVQPLDIDVSSLTVQEHLFTPTRKETSQISQMSGSSQQLTPPGSAPNARASSSLLDDPAEDPPVEEPSPTSPVAGKQLQREASASILCRQASELRRDSSQAGDRSGGSMGDLRAKLTSLALGQDDDEEVLRAPEKLTFDMAYGLTGAQPLGATSREGSFGLVWRCQSRKGDGDAAGGGTSERAAKRIAKARLAPRDVRCSA
eukprot:Skav218465  [mRNA]  locus=scaffold538:858317:861653:+ [translate_table: standard]